jgi:hypothetical protein
MGSPSDIISGRILALKNELDKSIQRNETLAQVNQGIVNFLMVTAVVASFLAGAGGLVFNWPKEVIGGLAIVPGFIAFAVASLKLQEKASLHFRYRDGLRMFRGRLLYQLPEFPSADNIAAIDKDLNDFRSQIQAETTSQAKFDFGQFKKKD